MSTIIIKQPCTESWTGMSDTANGRFCHQCQQEVMDFTKFTDQQLEAWFRDKDGKVCGRLNISQQNRELNAETQLRIPVRVHKPIHFLLGAFIALGISRNIMAVPLSPSVQWVYDGNHRGVSKKLESPVRLITVVVRGFEEHKPLEGVRFVVCYGKKDTVHMYTDSMGIFSFPIRKGRKKAREIKLANIFYQDYAYSVDSLKSNYLHIVLKSKQISFILGAIAYYDRSWWFVKTWRKIKRRIRRIF